MSECPTFLKPNAPLCLLCSSDLISPGIFCAAKTKGKMNAEQLLLSLPSPQSFRYQLLAEQTV